MKAQLDSIDWKILKELQRDGRITNVELARRVGISAPPCLRRVRALEEGGIITGYRALVDEKALGFDVIVSDARAKLATRERFPDADRIIRGWPDETLEQVDILPNTYVAILSHDPKFDEPALVGTLNTPAAYIGAIGSRKTNEDRRRRLAEAGMSPEQVARMRAPIGLDIGAATPEEMAISILGEIIALRRGRSGGLLTNATGNIRGERLPAAGA